MVDIISYKCLEIRSSPPILFLFKNINFYFFIWLCPALVAAHGILSCGM